MLQCDTLVLADAGTIEAVTGAPVGFAGPVGLEIPIIADYSVSGLVNAVAGANKADTHIANVNINRDYIPTKIADIREAKAGDKCVAVEALLQCPRYRGRTGI